MALLGLHTKLGPFHNIDEKNVIIHEIQLSIHFHPPIDPFYSHQLGDGNGWIIEFHE